MTPQEFIAKWSRVDLPERAASQEHFLDLCRLLAQPTPATHDATGAEYAFEKGVEVSAAASRGSKGDRGYADVWWRNKFAWEYKRKGKYKSLDDAYRQLCQYREALESPPLLIVSDIARTEIHTNFTGTRKEVHAVALADMAEPASLDLLRRVFTDPESFRPQIRAEQVTLDAAKEIGAIAQSLRDRAHDPHATAHFLMKCMFCLFAEDTALLPKGLFKQLLDRCKYDPPRLKSQMDSLFAAMKTGGDFGVEQIAFFNGGLFDDSRSLLLTEDEIAALIRAANQDWASVEPSIFGTLFERSLDPGKRAQIGAHYTSRDDIMLVIEPVILRPLRREWDEVRAKCEAWVEERAAAARAGKTRKKGSLTPETLTKRIEDALLKFDERLASLRVLDPACGSGNFLYVAIQQLLDLEKQVITYAADVGLGLIPHVRPTQLHGIEINPYAAELAQVVIWIGYLQWMRDNGFKAPANPILESLQTIQRRDAILAWEDERGKPIPEWREGAACRGPAEWPGADFIVGNPPFLGSRWFGEFGMARDHIDCLFASFSIPDGSDLCCYWFASAAGALKRKRSSRFGLLATQGIRGKTNRTVLNDLMQHSTIFTAHSDREWMLDGAAVHVSIICAAGECNEEIMLDNFPVTRINSDLTADVDTTGAQLLRENESICSRGSQKRGPFELPLGTARSFLAEPNPHGLSNIHVVVPWLNGADVVRRRRGMWIIDFGTELSLEESALFEAPMRYVVSQIRDERLTNNDPQLRQYWWRHGRPLELARRAMRAHSKVIVSPRVGKHHILAFVGKPVLPDDALVVVTRSDDYFFGVLHSSIHELWARRQGTQLREAESGFRYTPTTCFETFPLPWPPGHEPTQPGQQHHDLWRAISDAARDLDAQRERWLNPPEWIADIAAKVDAADDFADVAAVSGEEARRLIRQSAIDAAAAKDPRLKKRTLTNLYNERPTWLRLAHDRLDRAVLAAYAATDPAGPWNPDWSRVFVETGAGQPLPDAHALEADRAEVEERTLGALLGLNGRRGR